MLPNRKKNRLADYSYSQPGAYFITVCTKDKKPILGTIVGADAHIGPRGDVGVAPYAPPVGTDAHIGPGGDVGVAPYTPPVGADAHIGPHIRLTSIGTIVEKYLRSIPGLGEYVIMPNHVHMILHISASNVCSGPMWASAPTNAQIPSLIRSWKVLVSKELGQSIWQRSYYDHVIRDQNDYNIKVQYIRENPAKWFDDDYFA